MNDTPFAACPQEQKSISTERLIRLYALCISLFFLLAAPIAVIYTKEWDFLDNLRRILTSPSKLITDYFALGGLGSTLFNTAVCGLLANAVVFICRVRSNATTLAGYMLIVAHGFYGLNFLNMWPPFIGVLLYCAIMKKKVSENIHVAFFATALAPFVSEVLFRYSVGATIVSPRKINTPKTLSQAITPSMIASTATTYSIASTPSNWNSTTAGYKRNST